MTNAEIKFLELVPSQLKEIAKQLAKLNENMDKLISQNQAAPNLVKPSEKVVTICYNQREEWNDRQEAIKFESGETVCSDERLPTVKKK